ncbi:n-acetylmuramoyl-l-alanine amidase [hydrocarbon metagenome]|uniref:N-acetylmuramoyl-l-alanine amidase n=1 Tax=hydrocarbon metagenome TaxID=938273 RepID=A0A0W8E5P5_9ZZZZ
MIIDIYKYRRTIICTAIIGFVSAVFFFLALDDNCNDQAPIIEDSAQYGEFLSWAEVNKLFPKYCEAKVIDLETGSHFMIQRRGGTYHADVQPLTARDTEVMKKIYNDKWSWKRRAVIIQLDNNQKIAASMNGMPHGLGNIEGNNFDGHFCIHFKDSTTHGSRKVDTAHQLMIWKSAGLLDRQLSSLKAGDTIDVFLAAVDQGEKITAVKLLDTGSWNTILLLELANIDDIKTYEITPVDGNTFQTNVRLIYKGSSTSYNKSLLIETIQRGTNWRIDSQSLTPLFKANNEIPSTSIDAGVFEEDLEAGSL